MNRLNKYIRTNERRDAHQQQCADAGPCAYVLSLNCAARLVQCYSSFVEFPPSPPLIRIISQGAADTTLHVRVPGKPVESTGLECVIRGGLPPEWPISCNTPACVLICQFNILAECAKDINSLLLMHESAHVQFIFIITFIFPLLCILISNFPSSIRQSSSVTASTTNFKSRPKMPTLLREPAGIRRELHLRRGKPRIKLK